MCFSFLIFNYIAAGLRLCNMFFAAVLYGVQAMHHAMEEIKQAFRGWATFSSTLNAISKFFGNWSRVHRFRCTAIDRNDRFSAPVKASFGSMFRGCCPSLLEHRWEYVKLSLL